MYTNIPPQLWMLLDTKTRSWISKMFDLPRTGITEIRDSEVINDGHSLDDLRKITLEKMNEYIGSVETFPRAWELTCAKAKYELSPPPIEIKTTVGEVINKEIKQKNDK